MEHNNITIFTIRDFSFSYPLSKKIIRINGKIEIHKGEKVLIKGPSGSGKSTLLLALSGIIPGEIEGKLGGEILFKGRKIINFSPKDLHRRIGIVFQNPFSQRVTPTIEDELVFYLENLEFTSEEIDLKLKNLYNSFNLFPFINKSTKTLSGGELQKIILASVLIAEPEVLLFDEPTSYLDIKSEISFYKYLMENLKNQTVIIVDHKLNHNMKFIKRVIELSSEGDIIFDGSEKDYKNALIEGRVHREKRKWLLNNFNSLKNQNKKEKVRLEIKNLNFSYVSENQILKDINLSIKTGTVTSIFGLNGSGKTTLLKLAAKLIKPKRADNSNSTVFINSNGKKIIKKKLFYNYLGVVFQNPETHFLFQTVGKEISNGKNLENIDGIARAFNITDNIHQNPFTLSEGQKRRLNLANTFYMKKRIVLLDEPTFGQDEVGILNLIRTINTLKKNGLGFLIVSHDKKLIKSVSDRVFLLKNGSLKELKRIKKASGENSEVN